MNNKVYLIRHAESESNTGGVFEHQNTIKITENGKKQAEILALALEKPDKIICSSHIRTIETAEPLLKRYLEKEIHIWMDVHEFQPIDPQKYRGIMTEQRDIFHEQYWLKMDPHYADSDQNESFEDFIERANSSILKMKKLKGASYIFTHGNYIRGVITLLTHFKDYNSSKKNQNLYQNIMKEFTKSYLEGTLRIKNVGIFELSDLLNDYSEN